MSKVFFWLLLFGIYFSNWSWINSPQILKMSLIPFISSVFLNFGNFFARFFTEIKGHFKLCRLGNSDWFELQLEKFQLKLGCTKRFKLCVKITWNHVKLFRKLLANVILITICMNIGASDFLRVDRKVFYFIFQYFWA